VRFFGPSSLVSHSSIDVHGKTRGSCGPGEVCGPFDPIEAEDAPVLARQVVGDEVPALLAQEVPIRFDGPVRTATDTDRCSRR
jgi:hypothetical protein